jgi:hypothetical protein
MVVSVSVLLPKQTASVRRADARVCSLLSLGFRKTNFQDISSSSAKALLMSFSCLNVSSRLFRLLVAYLILAR